VANKEKILVIDDSPELLVVLEHLLRKNDYEPLKALDGETGLKLVREENPDLIILDLNMPGVDGWEVCEQIRDESDVPIIILTAAHVTEEDIVRGLDMGANDYVLKPSNNNVLLARIRSNLRWSNLPPSGVIFDDGHLKVDITNRQVLLAGEKIKLTKKEFELLVALVNESPRVVDHRDLFAKVWDNSYEFDVNYVRIFVGHLRKKIEPDRQNPTYIHNERGVGYRFEKQ
jgi:two-component system KDP operon response regulator KdpE